MKLIYTHVGISEVALSWLKRKAKEESQRTESLVTMADLIRRAIGELRQKELHREL